MKTRTPSKTKKQIAQPELKPKKKPCTFYIEPAIYDQLKKLEEKLRRGPTFIVNEALEDILKKHRINRK